jgi:hypothetical protein
MKILPCIDEKRELCRKIAETYEQKAKDNEGVKIQKRTITPSTFTRCAVYIGRIPSSISENLNEECREESKKYENLANSRLLYLKRKFSLEKVLNEL